MDDSSSKTKHYYKRITLFTHCCYYNQLFALSLNFINILLSNLNIRKIYEYVSGKIHEGDSDGGVSSGDEAGSPGPLEVVAAADAVDVEDFPGEVEAWDET